MVYIAWCNPLSFEKGIDIMLNMYNFPKAALYVRLSKEDRNKLNKDDDSESIINQQRMLLEYCRQHQFDVYKIYSDEDFSGSDRERPGFNQMIEDASKKEFNTIICKTQSRFARDMEIIEKYINGLFPIWGIRFISIVDNGDSMNKANRKSRQINSLIDQWYLEDLSDNIRATLSSKRRQGLWVGAFAPYGYIKDPNNKNHLVVDEEAAEVVRYVFNLYLQGMGITSIARKLNAQHIPNPATYKKQHGQPFQNINKECSNMWHTYSIQRMLSNEIYIGSVVQGIQEKISYKSFQKRKKPRSEWDIVADCHEAIIDLKTWNKVQRLKESKPKSGKTGSPNVLAGKVRCLTCGGSMRVAYNNHMRYFRCHTNFVDKSRCTGMTVSEKVLHREIIRQIQALYDMYADDEFVAGQIAFESSHMDKIELLTKTIKAEEKNIEKLNNRLSNIYIDKADGLITQNEFLTLKAKFSTDKEQSEIEIEKYRKKLEEVREELGKSKNQTEVIRQYKDIQKLDYVTVQALIDYIEIGGSRNNRIINIHWNL